MIELRADQTVEFKWSSPSGLLPTSMTAKLYDRSGGAEATATVTVPSGSTTVHTDHSTYISMNASTNFSAGDVVKITNDGVDYVRELSRIEAHAQPRFYLATDLPVSTDSGDACVALTATVSFAAVSADVGDGYYVEIIATDTDGNKEKATLGAVVVRWSWQRATAQDVAQVMSAVYQDERSHAFCSTVADRVNAKIEHALDSTGRRPWLYSGASNLFSEVIQAGIRYVLADHGIAPTGDLVSLLREMRFAFDDSLRVVVAGLREYDTDDDGKTLENQQTFYSVPTVR
tara:strand:+ start:1287 stop:2150 length:864 start_codon:yes stop_codon:yes gene_type:complete